MKINNIVRVLLYISSNDRETVINEITDFLDAQENVEEIKLENIEQFIASRQRGTKCDNE